MPLIVHMSSPQHQKSFALPALANPQTQAADTHSMEQSYLCQAVVPHVVNRMRTFCGK
jgi:hypothetical protein